MASTADIATTRQPKETKAQKVERLKRSKNPWEHFDEIKEFALQDRAAVLPEWANLYFKWWGIYTQGDGAGAIGGTGGEGKSTQYFMMRVALPNGLLRSNQLRAIAQISERYGHSLADLTVRQNIQLHWLTIESVPDVIEALGAVGLSPKSACGDVTRNITGCALAGIAFDELTDASSLAVEAAHLLSANNDFYNLPRKFKVSITGCPVWCSYPEINDVGFAPAVRERNGQREIGFSVRVGGGLSADPHLAVRLDAFIHHDQVIPVVRTIAEIFRDQDCLRENRERARLKHLFTQHGWTAQHFLRELNARLGFDLDPGVEDVPPPDAYRDHVGIHAQKQPGLYYVGAAVLRGRITAAQMHSAAALAEKYATGELRTTNMQNLLIVNVPRENIDALVFELNTAGLHVEASSFWRGAVACTGTEFCKLAITETKAFTRWLVEELEERVPEFDQPLKLNVAGCPNACGQHWIADIGLEGKKIKQGSNLIDAYYFCVGGSVGQHARISRQVGYRCTSEDVPEAIERLLKTYLATRDANENLRAYFARHSDDALRAQLAGAIVAPVTRDLPAGPVPHGVGD